MQPEHDIPPSSQHAPGEFTARSRQFHSTLPASSLGHTIARIGGLEDVKAIASCAAHDPGHLRMPVALLDIRLPLVDEVKLRRYPLQILAAADRAGGLRIVLEGEVPHCGV